MKMKVVVVVCVSVLIGATEAGLQSLSKFRTEIESKYCNGKYTCILHMPKAHRLAYSIWRHMASVVCCL